MEEQQPYVVARKTSRGRILLWVLIGVAVVLVCLVLAKNRHWFSGLWPTIATTSHSPAEHVPPAFVCGQVVIPVCETASWDEMRSLALQQGVSVTCPAGVITAEKAKEAGRTFDLCTCVCK